MKICVVGMGNMGQAIFDFLESGKGVEIFGCEREDDVNEKLRRCEAFIIAVKPQSFADFSASISIDLGKKIAISIMAGVSIENLQNKLKMKKVVRTLPNLPLKIGEAFTPWRASEELSESEKNQVKGILSSFGEEMELGDESQIEVVGALSGCGPAYFAFLAEQLEKYAVEHGFSPEQASKIAAVTFSGSGNLLKKTGWSPAELRAKITSKGGSTNAAITSLEENGFSSIFRMAFDAAVKRTKELNQ